jgi:hypothetical protein
MNLVPIFSMTALGVDVDGSCFVGNGLLVHYENAEGLVVAMTQILLQHLLLFDRQISSPYFHLRLPDVANTYWQVTHIWTEAMRLKRSLRTETPNSAVGGLPQIASECNTISTWRSHRSIARYLRLNSQASRVCHPRKRTSNCLPEVAWKLNFSRNVSNIRIPGYGDQRGGIIVLYAAWHMPAFRVLVQAGIPLLR